MQPYFQDAIHEFSRYKGLADRAMAPLADEAFFHRPAPQVNSIAIIVKHMAGNLRSRWTDFLTTDGEKPTRDRDQEFAIDDQDDRVQLLAAWDEGWRILFDSLGRLSSANAARVVTIRGEEHTVTQAILRSMNHAAYHVGQILYLSRLLCPESPWLTIAPGGSSTHQPSYRREQPR